MSQSVGINEFMDLLHMRYASPFSVLDEIITNADFEKWVEWFLNKVAEEKDENTLWEYFLHRVFDKSFNEFKAEIESERQQKKGMDEAKKEEIMQKSDAILHGFAPEKI